MLVKLLAPNGVEVNVPESRVERLKALGYKDPRAKKRVTKARQRE